MWHLFPREATRSNKKAKALTSGIASAGQQLAQLLADLGDPEQVRVALGIEAKEVLESGLPFVRGSPGVPRGHSLGERCALGVCRARVDKLPAALVAGRGHGHGHGQLGVAAKAAPEAQPVGREDCDHHCAE